MNNNLFVVVCPPVIQTLFDIEGFRQNAYLVNDDQGMTEFGSSAYFVRKSWLDNIEDF